jgi:hypothetical protein
MDLLMRYETSYSRMHDRAMKALERLQQDPPKKDKAAKAVVEERIPPVPDTVIPATGDVCEPQDAKLRNDPKPRHLAPTQSESNLPFSPSPVVEEESTAQVSDKTMLSPIQDLAS